MTQRRNPAPLRALDTGKLPSARIPLVSRSKRYLDAWERSSGSIASPPTSTSLERLPPEDVERTDVERTEPVTTAKAQLRDIAAELEKIRFRLLGVQASLPVSPPESDPLLEDDALDAATEIRAAIGCVLEDRLGPALRDLQAATR